MNCQPSFRTGSVPVVGSVLGGLDGLAFVSAEAASDAREGVASDPSREPPRRRVPDCDIIDVGGRVPGARRDEPVDVRDLAYAVAPPAASPGRRNYTKPLLALLILQVAVTGGLYLKKRYAEAQVIVVPASVEGTVIT